MLLGIAQGRGPFFTGLRRGRQAVERFVAGLAQPRLLQLRPIIEDRRVGQGKALQ